MFYLTTHSTHFIYGYMASDIWLRTILIVRKETRCRHIGYSYRLTARVLLYASSHRQDNTYHGLCYTSRGALAGTRNSSMGPPHEGSIRRPIAPYGNALPLSYVPLPCVKKKPARVVSLKPPHRVQPVVKWGDFLYSPPIIRTRPTDVVRGHDAVQLICLNSFVKYSYVDNKLHRNGRRSISEGQNIVLISFTYT